MVCPRFIAEMMAGRGITQAVLADRSGRTQGFVSKVLAGLQPVPWDDLDAWSTALELAPEQATLLKRYAIRSYGPACANEIVDALDHARAQLDALSREVETTASALESTKRYAEAIEREAAGLRGELAALRATGVERRSG